MNKFFITKAPEYTLQQKKLKHKEHVTQGIRTAPIKQQTPTKQTTI
jgi:hypothetical protein